MAKGAKKNQAAVELGRRGGLKGGHARARKLSKEQLSEAGRKAVLARWKKAGKPIGELAEATTTAVAAKFISCPACGRKGVSDQAIMCPGCGHPLMPRCGKCGSKMMVVWCEACDTRP